MKFDEMGLSKSLLDSLHTMGFATPTPIQEQAIPILLKGEDLIGQAQTGTGKTAAFGLPILEAWLKMKNAPHQIPSHQPNPQDIHKAQNMRTAESHGRPARFASGHAVPTALILVPTRELAVQVCSTLQKMAGITGARVIAIYGGIEMRKQLRMFHTPVDVLVGTPGRTLDHLRQGTLRLNEVRAVVLDEADRMLDMGFIRDVVKILNDVPAHRQTMLFSATIPHEVAQIAHKYMRNPKTVKVSEDSLTVEGIKQLYVRASNASRLGMLLAAIREEKPFLSLVFTRTKHDAKKLARLLKFNGVKADAMHGNLSQNARERAMARFRSGDIELLVATDLASRGIDVPGITHVFNYEMPPDPLTYVHRIGRTGRAGKNGTSISLIAGDPRHTVRRIENATGSTMKELVLEPEEVLMPEAHEERHGGNFSRRQPHGRRDWPGNRESGRHGGSNFSQSHQEGRGQAHSPSVGIGNRGGERQGFGSHAQAHSEGRSQAQDRSAGSGNRGREQQGQSSHPQSRGEGRSPSVGIGNRGREQQGQSNQAHGRTEKVGGREGGYRKDNSGRHHYTPHKRH